MSYGSFDVRLAQPYHEQAAKAGEDRERLAQLKYHLDSGDYFAFLATIFGILEEGLLKKPNAIAHEELSLIESIRKDLVYLQSEYHIEPVAIEA